MTNLLFDANNLRNRLDRLSHRHILTFGVWQLERMVPNFLQFCVESQWEGTWVLKGTVSYAWSVIETGNPDRFDELTADLCDRIAPDTEDFTSIYTSSALDSAISAGNLIKYIHSNEIDFVVEMASLARDSADIFIQLSNFVSENDDNFEDLVRAHPLMQQELRHQESDLTFLEGLRESGERFFSAVLARSLAEQYGKKWL